MVFQLLLPPDKPPPPKQWLKAVSYFVHECWGCSARQLSLGVSYMVTGWGHLPGFFTLTSDAWLGWNSRAPSGFPLTIHVGPPHSLHVVASREQDFLHGAEGPQEKPAEAARPFLP